MSAEQGKPTADQRLNFGWLESLPDEYFLPAFLINGILRKIPTRKRARIIHTEGDAVPAMGVWTPEESEAVARRLVIENGEYVDPQQRKGLMALVQYLGFVK